MYGKTLKKQVKSETSGSYGKMLVYTLSKGYKSDAKLLRDAMAGLVRVCCGPTWPSSLLP